MDLVISMVCMYGTDSEYSFPIGMEENVNIYKLYKNEYLSSEQIAFDSYVCMRMIDGNCLMSNVIIQNIIIESFVVTC